MGSAVLFDRIPVTQKQVCTTENQGLESIPIQWLFLERLAPVVIDLTAIVAKVNHFVVHLVLQRKV
jgi:hypothetical protein